MSPKEQSAFTRYCLEHEIDASQRDRLFVELEIGDIESIFFVDGNWWIYFRTEQFNGRLEHVRVQDYLDGQRETRNSIIIDADGYSIDPDTGMTAIWPKPIDLPPLHCDLCLGEITGRKHSYHMTVGRFGKKLFVPPVVESC